MDGMSSGSMYSSFYEGIAQMIEQATGVAVDIPSGSSSSSESSSSSSDGITVGRWNSFSGGINASMPIVNAQLWKSLEISGKSVELAVEQARSSRLDMVTQVKQAYYAVLLAREAFEVYREVYENAVDNFGQIDKKFRAEKASELELTRAKVNIANAIPNVYQAENNVMLSLWQLKAVMGVDLDEKIDVTGSLSDYASQMAVDLAGEGAYSLDNNTTMRQLAIQAEQLAQTVKMQKYAYIPTLSGNFAYMMMANTNDFKFSEYRWTPYSYAGLSLSIPIFTPGQSSKVKQAQIQADELDLNRINTERQLRISIRQYLNTMQTSIKSYDTAVEAEKMAQKAYNVQAKSYDVGKSTLTDLNDTQLALTQAQLSVSQAIYNYLVAKSNLEQIIGSDFIDEEGNVDLENR